MAVTLVTSARNALADALDVDVNSGGGTATLLIRASTTTLVTFNLSNPAFGAAASGVITLAGTPITATATGSGTADGFQVNDRAGSLVYSGTVTATGGGGDIELDNTNIASSQSVELTSHTVTMPAT